MGPDGAREIRLRLDFATDLLSFDLDSDGVFDDLVAVDFDHDAIADNLAPLLLNLDYTKALKVSGIVTAVGSSTITVANKTLNVAEITNIDNAASAKALSLAEIGIGSAVDVQYAVSGNDSVALKVDVKLDPSGPQPVLKVQREGLIEQLDSTTLFVAGILFHDYADAQIVNLLDQPLTPADVAVGKYVTVTGTREGDTVKADFIQVHETPPAPTYFEREGVIDGLAGPEELTWDFSLGGIQFTLSDQTVIRDSAGHLLDKTYLKIGDPAWVYAQQTGSTAIALIVELKYEIEQPDGKHVEVVVIVDNPAFMPQVRAAIDNIDSPVPVVLIRATNTVAQPDDPPCVGPILADLYHWRDLLAPLKGFQNAYAMPDGDQCKSLVVITYGEKLTVNIINAFFPDGIGGSPIAWDEAFFDAPYGAGPEFNEALGVADSLAGLVSDGLAAMVYASPDQGFRE
jgi:hypothetical protein